jgi:hypothetical protein
VPVVLAARNADATTAIRDVVPHVPARLLAPAGGGEQCRGEMAIARPIRGGSLMKRLVPALLVVGLAMLGTPVPGAAGDLSVSIVGDGYAVRPGYGGEILYYGPPAYAAPPVYPGFAYVPPPQYYGGPLAYGYYGPPPVYGYGAPGRYGFGPQPFLYGRRAFRLPR